MNLRLIVCVVMILVSLSKARPQAEDVPSVDNPTENLGQIPSVDAIPNVADLGNIPGGLDMSAINPNSGGGAEDTEPQDTESEATDSEATGGGDANPPAAE
ncbi:UNVERIFIED_CONTAM: hypothetical protein RMT77_007315 [Armadillidium vulgare]